MSIDRFRNDVSSAFTTLEQRLNGAGSGPWHQLRKQAHVSFLEQGIPTPRQEEWKYTNVLPLFGMEYRPVSGEAIPQQPLNTAAIVALEEIRTELGSDAHFLCLLDGGYISTMSTATDAPSGVTIQPLTDALVAEDEEIRAALSSAAPLDAHPFVALNTTLASGGIVIRIARNTTVEHPLHVGVIGDARSGSILHTPRILVIAEEGAQVSVVESHHTVGEHTAMDLTVTEIIAKRNAHVRHVKVNADEGDGRQIGYTGAKVWGDGTVTTHVFCLGGSFTRNDLVIDLLEPNAEAYLDGVSVLNGQEYADNHTVVDHTVPHCHSEELYKGVYDGKSTGVFNGKIFVRPQAQKTTAYQSNHSLLLSDRAQINAKPQLEIWADDVKCSHGATTGQLDEDAVFYLQARGIGKNDARALMTYAFAAEVVERLPLEGLRSWVERRIARKLGADQLSL